MLTNRSPGAGRAMMKLYETTLAWVADDVLMAWPRFAAYSVARPGHHQKSLAAAQLIVIASENHFARNSRNVEKLAINPEGCPNGLGGFSA
jgi:hypothetical protein